MICENKIGEQFDYLAQRVVYVYMVSYSKFQPIYDDEVSEEAQNKFIVLLMRFYTIYIIIQL